MDNINNNELEYKSFNLFYGNLYERLFNLINNIIDESHFNINKTKDELRDFLDNYSYYVIQKKQITREEHDKGVDSDKNILNNIKEFDNFTKELNIYPSKDYIKYRQELKKNVYDLSKLNQTKYNYLIREYYLFFNEVIKILQNFINVTSINGFLPNVKSKSALKTIGWANYQAFFIKLEELKIKMSTITTTIKLNNVFKSRRCVLSILVVFSPYFTRMEIYEMFIKKLDFKFIGSDEVLLNLKKSYQYEDLFSMPKYLKDNLNNEVVKPIKVNTSLIKRYIALEFGERDLNPKIRRKYAYDPTGV